MTRPFTRPASRLGAYNLWTWVGSLCTGLVAAARAGYRPVYHMCWVAEETDSALEFGNSAGAFLAGHFFACSLASAAATFVGSVGSKEGY